MVQGSFFEMNDGETVTDFKAPIVFNIGYQSHTITSFIGKLKANKIDVLVDLRSKPWSRLKYFSKPNLKRVVEDQAIKYMWRGEELGGMGVSPETWRKTLKPLADHAKNKRICLMCMESSINQCHRKQLMEILISEHGIQGVNL